jgi:Flp pilus assembly protein CpaB
VRGLVGLVIAAGLGLAGAVCNWLYLDSRAQTEARVAFIGVKPDVQLRIGDVFRADHFEPVELPKSRLGNLEDAAPLWEARDAVIGLRANKAYGGGELILRQDLTTPAQEDLASMLADDEVARWVPIDSRSVISEQINPGDLVSFEAPRPRSASTEPTPETSGPPQERQAENLSSLRETKNGNTEIIGPFRVLAVGARRERPNIQQARGRTGGNENTITIAARLTNGEIEPRAAKLFEAVRAAGSQGIYVMLHSAKTE